jgi:dipeptidyl aminopeptidase/acylaminoacyl peptidase
MNMGKRASWMRDVGKWVSVILLLLAGPSYPQQSRPSVDGILRSLSQLVEFRSLDISPDGKRLAWVEKVRGKDGPLPDRSMIVVAGIGAKYKLTRKISVSVPGASDEHEPVWSPDGEQLAFLSDAKKRHQAQLYVAHLKSGRLRQLTDLKGTLADPRWSPDGRRLAFRFIEGVEAKGPLDAAPRDTGVVQETIHESRIMTIDLATGRLRPISPPELFVYEYDWSPDGSKFAAVAAPGSGDDNWWVAELFTFSTESGQATLLLKPKMQLAEPRWSPDGKSIAFVGGLMSDEDVVGGDVFIISAQGGEPRNLTPKAKASVSSLYWLTPDAITVAEYVGGSSGIAAVSPSNGEIRALWTGPERIGATGLHVSLALARDGKTSAVVRESFQRPAEVYAGPIGSWSQVSHANSGIEPAWGQVREVRWRNEGFEEQGWLISPPDVDPQRRYPMVVHVHGGPASATLPRFYPLWGVLASQGYFVFLPNPRGSYGQGESYTSANVRDFGYGDLRDILAGIDAAEREAPIDPQRLGIFGWSYGGFMAMWAVTQTERFHAAVAGAGIANWQSYYGQNRIDQWMLPYFGASVYDDPAAYAHSSPITFIKKVRTPTLILQGERDAEVPAPQAYEFWHALKTLGVETQLVIYPDEGHRFAKPEHRRDLMRRIVGWFDQLLSGRKGG